MRRRAVFPHLRCRSSGPCTGTALGGVSAFGRIPVAILQPTLDGLHVRVDDYLVLVVGQAVVYTFDVIGCGSLLKTAANLESTSRNSVSSSKQKFHRRGIQNSATTMVEELRID